MKKIMVSIVVAASLFVGCAGNNSQNQPTVSQQQGMSKMLMMQQQKTQLINQGIVAGLGVGKAGSEQLAYNEADLNARADCARMLENKVQQLVKSYEEQAGEQFTHHTEAVAKAITSRTVQGVSIIKMDMEAEGGLYSVYAIAAMNPKVVQEAYMEAMKAKQADESRVRASKGYQDLEKEAAAFEAQQIGGGI